MSLEERAQRIVDLEAELNLHATFWGAGLCSTSLIITEYDTIIALCEEILPDLPKHPEAMRKTIAKLKRTRRKYVKHREEEVTELVRERLDESGLEHVEIVKVERLEGEAED